MSLFKDGRRQAPPQQLPENLQGKVGVPCSTWGWRRPQGRLVRAIWDKQSSQRPCSAGVVSHAHVQEHARRLSHEGCLPALCSSVAETRVIQTRLSQEKPTITQVKCSLGGPTSSIETPHICKTIGADSFQIPMCERALDTKTSEKHPVN